MSEILITKNKTRESVMRELDSIIYSQSKDLTDPILYNKIVGCINDYFQHLERLSRDGTTIELLQSFSINGKNLTIRIKHPPSIGLLYRLSRFFRKA